MDNPTRIGYCKGGSVSPSRYATGGEVKKSFSDRVKGRHEAQSKRREGYNAGLASSAADFIPIVGDVKGAYEVYDEINKPNPNWYLVGALGGAAIIGAIPFIGDAAANAIKAGAKNATKGAVKKSSAIIDEGMQPNIKERAIAAGIDLPGLDGGVVRPEMVNKAQSNSGWNFSGKPAGEFAKDMEQVHKGILDTKFLTDTEVSAKEKGILGDYLQNAGSATLEDVDIANEIAQALSSASKGNQSSTMIIDDILSKADHSKLNINGIAGAISDKLGISYKEAKLLLINSKYAFD